jgi:hypothetical protein
MRDFIGNVLERVARSLAFLDEIRTPEAAERHLRHEQAVAERADADDESFLTAAGAPVALGASRHGDPNGGPA